MKHPHRHNLNLISWLLAVIAIVLMCCGYVWPGILAILFAFLGNAILYTSELNQPPQTKPAKQEIAGSTPAPSYGQRISVNGIPFRVDLRMCITGKPDRIAFVDCGCLLPGEQKRTVRFTVPEYHPAREKDRIIFDQIMQRNGKLVKVDREKATDSLRHREATTVNPDHHTPEPLDPHN